MALCSKASTLPLIRLSTPVSTPPSGISFRFTSVRSRRDVSVLATARFGSLKGGAGVLERPTFDQSQFDPIPEAEEGGDIGRLRDKKGLRNGDSYKVLLVDDERHTEKLVENALPKVVPSITTTDARRLFHESRQIGVAVVIVTVKEHAEFYAQMMVRSGLRSAIEPDSDAF
ncbi:hypothetical protein QJS04_geneDACA019139 [Acorus gramineus]|uniref:Adaptor protein ClpS core domain-containing protein n=1 Tax=Acorus gramineus TaxID=55184 RepID=A0AAV9BAJ9_ACOGR|nr:hypothetical protein QJS04_geneDACA019139 [Acorus gramineus]